MHIGDFKLSNECPSLPSPKVAVIMPVYNDHKYLDEAIDSVLNQSYSNLVLIVINDGSTIPEVNHTLSQY